MTEKKEKAYQERLENYKTYGKKGTKKKPVPPKTSNRIDEVITPIFDVHLGESLHSLKNRFAVTASTYSFEDKDHPGKIWDINPSNVNVKRLMINTFNEKGRIVRSLIDWLGYEAGEVHYIENARQHGEASFSFINCFSM